MEDVFFKESKIKVNRELNREDKKLIVNQFVDLLTEKFYFLKIDSIKLYHSLLDTKMYIVHIPNNVSYVNYSYKTKSLYFSDCIDTLKFDDIVLHEFIHCIQDRIDKQNHIGLCEFNKSAINGLMINEAANQYISNVILDRVSNRVRISGITINTKSNNHFPLVTNLMEEIAILFGEKTLVNSTILADGVFKKMMSDIIGDDNCKQVYDGFDKILYLFKDINPNNQNGVRYNIKEIFYSTQKLLYREFFNSIKLEETNIDELKEKLVSLKNKFENTESYDDYILFYDQKMVEIEHYEMSRYALVKINNNIFTKLFRSLRRYKSSEYNKNTNK